MCVCLWVDREYVYGHMVIVQFFLQRNKLSDGSINGFKEIQTNFLNVAILQMSAKIAR